MPHYWTPNTHRPGYNTLIHNCLPRRMLGIMPYLEPFLIAFWGGIEALSHLPTYFDTAHAEKVDLKRFPCVFGGFKRFDPLLGVNPRFVSQLRVRAWVTLMPLHLVGSLSLSITLWYVNWWVRVLPGSTLYNPSQERLSEDSSLR